jgi:hypothetical protein
LAYESFVNQTNNNISLAEEKRIWTASCLVQIKLPETLLERGRREGGRERRREDEKSLLTNLQLLSKSKH